MYDCCSCCRPCNGIRLWLRKELVCQEILAVATAVIFPLKKVLSAVEVVIQNWTGVWERGKAGSRYGREMGVLKAFLFSCLTISIASYHYVIYQESSWNLESPQILATCSLCYTNWGKNTKHQTFDNVKLCSQLLERKIKLQPLQADRTESHCANAVCHKNCAAWELSYLLPMETVQAGDMHA